jgi:hypothetical protein
MVFFVAYFWLIFDPMKRVLASRQTLGTRAGPIEQHRATEKRHPEALTFLFFSPPLTNRRRQRAPPQEPLGARASRVEQDSAKAGSVTGFLARFRQ